MADPVERQGPQALASDTLGEKKSPTPSTVARNLFVVVQLTAKGSQPGSWPIGQQRPTGSIGQLARTKNTKLPANQGAQEKRSKGLTGSTGCPEPI